MLVAANPGTPGCSESVRVVIRIMFGIGTKPLEFAARKTPSVFGGPVSLETQIGMGLPAGPTKNRLTRRRTIVARHVWQPGA